MTTTRIALKTKLHRTIFMDMVEKVNVRTGSTDGKFRTYVESKMTQLRQPSLDGIDIDWRTWMDVYRKFRHPAPGTTNNFGVLGYPLAPIVNGQGIWGYMMHNLGTNEGRFFAFIYRANGKGVVFQGKSASPENLSITLPNSAFAIDVPMEISFSTLSKEYLAPTIRLVSRGYRYSITIAYPGHHKPLAKQILLHPEHEHSGLWTINEQTGQVDVNNLLAVCTREEYEMGVFGGPKGETMDLLQYAGVK